MHGLNRYTLIYLNRLIENMKEAYFALGAIIGVAVLMVVLLNNSLDNSVYSSYVSVVKNENWCRGTYDQAVKVFQRELNNPNNKVEFVYNELQIRNEDSSTSLSCFKIKVNNVYMLMSKEDYFRYKKYVLRTSREYTVGKETKADW